MSYKLMIKIHNKTGLKYLCITKRENWERYPGSGKRWLSHLKKHGYDFQTILLYDTEDYSKFLEVCSAVSTDLDVVISEEFANLVPENGYSNDYGLSNLEMFWIYASEETKKEVIERRNKTIKEIHWTKTKENSENDDIRKKISEKVIESWNNKSIEERREAINTLQEGAKKFFCR